MKTYTLHTVSLKYVKHLGTLIALKPEPNQIVI